MKWSAITVCIASALAGVLGLAEAEGCVTRATVGAIAGFCGQPWRHRRGGGMCYRIHRATVKDQKGAAAANQSLPNVAPVPASTV